MSVITFFNPKGGVGCTSLVHMLAVEATRHHLSTLVIDPDRYARSTHHAWLTRRMNNGHSPLINRIAHTDPRQMLEQCSMMDVVIIDAANSDHDRMEDYAAISDVIVMPVTSSMPEADTALANARQFVHEYDVDAERIVFVINLVMDGGDYENGAVVNKDLYERLFQSPFTLIHRFIPRRGECIDALDQGKTLAEVEDVRLRELVVSCLDELMEQIIWPMQRDVSKKSSRTKRIA